jgi:hypothetical protein
MDQLGELLDERYHAMNEVLSFSELLQRLE